MLRISTKNLHLLTNTNLVDYYTYKCIGLRIYYTLLFLYKLTVLSLVDLEFEKKENYFENRNSISIGKKLKKYAPDWGLEPQAFRLKV
jgi:hypothetical protein